MCLVHVDDGFAKVRSQAVDSYNHCDSGVSRTHPIRI